MYVNPESYKRGHFSNKTLNDDDNEVWCDRDDDNNNDDGDGHDDVVSLILYKNKLDVK